MRCLASCVTARKVAKLASTVSDAQEVSGLSKLALKVHRQYYESIRFLLANKLVTPLMKSSGDILLHGFNLSLSGCLFEQLEE